MIARTVALRPRRLPRAVSATRSTPPPLAPRLRLVRSVLVLVGVLSLLFVAQLVLVSSLQQRAAQRQAFDRFRVALASGTAPTAAGALQGAEGDPVAYLEVPALGVRQVVLEGTSGRTLTGGPGHRRDTPLPGQEGTSVLLGRRAAFGGPFAELDRLQAGDTVRVTTGAGVFDHRVLGVRRAGDPAPAARAAGAGRLVLATADGAPFLPSGLLVVDAELVIPAVGGSAPRVSPAGLSAAERPMAIDTSTLWRLLLWLQALVAVALAGVWSWHRWHRAKTWIVFVPPFLLVGLFVAGEATNLLPNLL